ncbi:MAG: PDR/VanB family oxidoreductase [Alphaproteobacteria bacterium]|nr:PDR/VanB family oxidoreductase [Alphaproteobacteria bacterium]
MPETPSPALPVRVTRKEEIARDIWLFELRDPTGAELPAFTAGAHTAVELPNGLIRKYSLCNDPAERDRYLIAVKRENEGRGGSIAFIDQVEPGYAICVAPPVNDFPLPARATDFLFIAGGIGITPIMAMIHQLRVQDGKRFRLYYCTRSPDMTAFRHELAAPAPGGRVTIHHDHGHPDRFLDLWPILEQRRNREHLYCCGPRTLMQAVRDMTGHWTPTSVHFEAFSEPEKTKPDDRPFVLHLERSGTDIEVPVGTTILEAMRARGHDAPSSCESGTCGTCRTVLIEGEADHRDLVLAEHERGNQIMLCVSRALSARLVIDR